MVSKTVRRINVQLLLDILKQNFLNLFNMILQIGMDTILMNLECAFRSVCQFPCSISVDQGRRFVGLSEQSY